MTIHNQTIPNDRRRTIREWRAYRRLQKGEIATRMGVFISAYSRMENEPEEIEMKDAEKLASIFGCSLYDIIFFEQNPNFKLENTK
ncbi:helix-turn-helix transcriptional regulator [Paenibacillus vini]|uniref:helix-turn-helix domain-containing protein n=1 Tax=Paenibacillus vini TaxID=1476024 RepID=UPI0025B71004|nr:helix-turn-helix transcriptional regulator [Paenibacillus vini]MDN4069985.1 helix-turn-helix transcriptional regulator [Paenibacillus vini]